ncbi:MAG TPA: hypothetical protein V6D30_07720 [Leptolyngbyaceae cyanobacterium]
MPGIDLGVFLSIATLNRRRYFTYAQYIRLDDSVGLIASPRPPAKVKFAQAARSWVLLLWCGVMEA